MKLKMNSEYKAFIEEIKRRVRASQYAALKAVNKELISLYWDIGRSIVEQQNKSGWGKAIVETMAKDLQNEFPGIQGFSAQNFWRMKQFFQAYSGNAKLSPLVREIGWTHNMIILMVRGQLPILTRF
jgi:predicted nuclease of restriction endonuclease-like (RecB) superfamily